MLPHRISGSAGRPVQYLAIGSFSRRQPANESAQLRVRAWSINGSSISTVEGPGPAGLSLRGDRGEVTQYAAASAHIPDVWSLDEHTAVYGPLIGTQPGVSRWLDLLARCRSSRDEVDSGRR